MIKQTILIFLCIPLLICCNERDKKQATTHLSSLEKNIGEPFTMRDIRDSSGLPVTIDFTGSRMTIIDFWFSTCPTCIEEMRQFPELLKGKESKLKIISISINRFQLWKQIFKAPGSRFDFLQPKLANWAHYNISIPADDQLKNDISISRQQELVKQYDLAFFPAYFVVDPKGIIVARPASAVAYIKALNL
ncbi:MAG: Redoxin [Ferruginibacter sp.]|nr:Redoxin [Ferruginibacter sp.]